MTAKFGQTYVPVLGCGDSGPARTCQYIPGDPRTDPSKCGARSKPGSSYCPDHHARCYQPLVIRDAAE